METQPIRLRFASDVSAHSPTIRSRIMSDDDTWGVANEDLLPEEVGKDAEGINGFVDGRIKVAIRVKPTGKSASMISFPTLMDDSTAGITIGGDKTSRTYAFDHVFKDSDAQSVVYTAAAPLVSIALEGYNVAILTYGQTGAGKTHTMLGTRLTRGALDALSEDAVASIMFDGSEQWGLVPRFLCDFWSQLGKIECDGLVSSISVSMLEVYQEDVHDLLSGSSDAFWPSSPDATPMSPTATFSTMRKKSLRKIQRVPLKVREDKTNGVVVAGLTSIAVDGAATALKCLLMGLEQRTTAATHMNDASSRSHMMFVVSVEIIPDSVHAAHVDAATAGVMGSSKRFKMAFCDLAGSERLKRTKALGQQMKEGISINSGLLALGNVISALADPVRRKSGISHIPYRDSKLTRLLQDYIGGNSATLFIACVDPSPVNFEESVQTLRYANRAKNIRNHIKKNVDPAQEAIEELRRHVAVLRTELVRRTCGLPTINDAWVRIHEATVGADEPVANMLRFMNGLVNTHAPTIAETDILASFMSGQTIDAADPLYTQINSPAQWQKAAVGASVSVGSAADDGKSMSRETAATGNPVDPVAEQFVSTKTMDLSHQMFATNALRDLLRDMAMYEQALRREQDAKMDRLSSLKQQLQDLEEVGKVLSQVPYYETASRPTGLVQDTIQDLTARLCNEISATSKCIYDLDSALACLRQDCPKQLEECGGLQPCHIMLPPKHCPRPFLQRLSAVGSLVDLDGGSREALEDIHQGLNEIERVIGLEAEEWVRSRDHDSLASQQRLLLAMRRVHDQDRLSPFDQAVDEQILHIDSELAAASARLVDTAVLDNALGKSAINPFSGAVVENRVAGPVLQHLLEELVHHAARAKAFEVCYLSAEASKVRMNALLRNQRDAFMAEVRQMDARADQVRTEAVNMVASLACSVVDGLIDRGYHLFEPRSPTGHTHPGNKCEVSTPPSKIPSPKGGSPPGRTHALPPISVGAARSANLKQSPRSVARKFMFQESDNGGPMAFVTALRKRIADLTVENQRLRAHVAELPSSKAPVALCSPSDLKTGSPVNDTLQQEEASLAQRQILLAAACDRACAILDQDKVERALGRAGTMDAVMDAFSRHSIAIRSRFRRCLQFCKSCAELMLELGIVDRLRAALAIQSTINSTSLLPIPVIELFKLCLAVPAGCLDSEFKQVVIHKCALHLLPRHPSVVPSMRLLDTAVLRGADRADSSSRKAASDEVKELARLDSLCHFHSCLQDKALGDSAMARYKSAMRLCHGMRANRWYIVDEALQSVSALTRQFNIPLAALAAIPIEDSNGYTPHFACRFSSLHRVCLSSLSFFGPSTDALESAPTSHSLLLQAELLSSPLLRSLTALEIAAVCKQMRWHAIIDAVAKRSARDVGTGRHHAAQVLPLDDWTLLTLFIMLQLFPHQECKSADPHADI